MPAMTRLLATSTVTAIVLGLLAPGAALAQSSGMGSYGETTDKVVTNAGFIIIGAFPTLILLLSLLQYFLEKRKDDRKKAVKARGGEQRWAGGW